MEENRITMIDREPLLKHYVMETHKLAMRKNLDWLTVIGGREGQAGKSTLATIIALWHDPEFDPKTQAIYDTTTFLDYLDNHEKEPGKCAWFDEAVLQFLGEDSNTSDAKFFKKLFVTHRDLNQIYLLCSPSPWLVNPYIREWRVSDFVLGYMDAMSKDFERYYAYYSKTDYAKFITNTKAKKQIIIPSEFVKKYKPTMGEHFYNIDSGAYGIEPSKLKHIFDEMFAKKKEAQRRLRKEMREYITTNGEIQHAPRIKASDIQAPIVDILVNEEHYTQKRACEIVGMTDRRYRQIKEEGRK